MAVHSSPNRRDHNNTKTPDHLQTPASVVRAHYMCAKRTFGVLKIIDKLLRSAGPWMCKTSPVGVPVASRLIISYDASTFQCVHHDESNFVLSLSLDTKDFFTSPEHYDMHQMIYRMSYRIWKTLFDQRGRWEMVRCVDILRSGVSATDINIVDIVREVVLGFEFAPLLIYEIDKYNFDIHIYKYPGSNSEKSMIHNCDDVAPPKPSQMNQVMPTFTGPTATQHAWFPIEKGCAGIYLINTGHGKKKPIESFGIASKIGQCADLWDRWKSYRQTMNIDHGKIMFPLARFRVPNQSMIEREKLRKVAEIVFALLYWAQLDNQYVSNVGGENHRGVKKRKQKLELADAEDRRSNQHNKSASGSGSNNSASGSGAGACSGRFVSPPDIKRFKSFTIDSPPQEQEDEYEIDEQRH